MARKGWSTLEVPDGGLQVIRGSRLPAGGPQRLVVVVRTGHRPQTFDRKKATKGKLQPPQIPVPEVRRSAQQVFPVAQEDSCAFTVGSGRNWETTTVPRQKCCTQLDSFSKHDEVWSVATTEEVVSEVEAKVRPLQAAFLAFDQLNCGGDFQATGVCDEGCPTVSERFSKERIASGSRKSLCREFCTSSGGSCS